MLVRKILALALALALCLGTLSLAQAETEYPPRPQGTVADLAGVLGEKTITDMEELKRVASVFYDEAMMLEGFEIKDKQEFIQNLNALMLKAYQK